MSEQKTHAEIIAKVRKQAKLEHKNADRLQKRGDDVNYGIGCSIEEDANYLESIADCLEAARRREIDVLKRRINELDAEIAAKDEVIKRLNDAIAEEQRRKMATTENSSAVGDASKLREAMRLVSRVAEQMTRGTITGEAPTRKEVDDWAMRLCDIIGAALAAPPRNCDALTADERTHKFIEKWEKAHGESIDGKTIIYLSSFSRWTQLPYESEVGK